MRQKKAKTLRKIARELSAGMPDRKLVAAGRPTRVKVTNPRHAEYGNYVVVTRSCIINDQKSTRGIYLNLKRHFMKGQKPC